MGAGHAHAHGTGTLRIGRWPGVVVVVLIVLSAAAAMAGVVACWPDTDRVHRVQGLVPVVANGVEEVHGELLRVRSICVKAGETRCGASVARVLDGRSAGRTVAIDLSPDVVGTGLRPGDRVLLLDTSRVTGGQGSDFSFYRADRGAPMLWLAILFAVLVVVVALRRGLMALVSLGAAGAVIALFLLPALLSGSPPVPTTLSASVLILIVMLYATHGISMRTSVALIGALVGVAISTAFAWYAVIGSRLAGLGDDAAGLLVFNVPWISVQQLVVASVVLAGLGTLNDVTITQVSALWELRALSGASSRRQLFASAMRIGRDHVASTVYTLVFAYLGTSLVLIVGLQLYGGTPAGFLTAEDVAEEVVRTLVGGIALVLAMPVTTFIGTLVVSAGSTEVAATPARRRSSSPLPAAVPANPYRRLPDRPWDED